mmetsp:Transcript_7278/g.19054  ORF Transcript_7278/g.19054 Transcript_7278/m.19054 type:complete len:226 (-) Transcript_7278:51-728(-)
MIFVAVNPGTSRNAFTLQPGMLRNVCCIFSVSTLTPALLTLYATSPGGEVMPCLLPVLTTTHGQSCSIIEGTNASPPQYTPHRLVSRILRHRSGCSKVPHCPFVCMAALFIRKCTAPNLANASSLSATTCDSLRQSQVTDRTSVHFAPAATSSRRTLSHDSISASSTFIPSFAHRRAAARPMPDAHPMMTATEPRASTPEVSTGAAGIVDFPRGTGGEKCRRAKA